MAVKKKQKKQKKTNDEGTNNHDNSNKRGSKVQHQPPVGFGVIVISSLLVLVLSVCLFYIYGTGSSLENPKKNAHKRAATADNSKCGIWIAKSTLPNAGIGMFAGRKYAPKQHLGVDRVVPIIDMEKYQGSGWPFLWNAYTWNSERLENEADSVSLTLHGFGSTANAHMDLNNVFMEPSQQDKYVLPPLHRSKDPGVGASTTYYEGMSAKEALKEGQELFMSYGDSWFITRTNPIGYVPLHGDVGRADSLFKSWRQLSAKYGLSKGVFKEYWETFVWKSPMREKSRVLAALPNNWTKLDRVTDSSLRTHLQHESTRSMEWLEENGICADNFRPGASEIPQAGGGAFATRPLAKGAIVAPLPLIHVPFRQKFQMQNQHQFQLLLNYCFGHRQSTLLLCPYGSMTSYINHNHQHPNVKIQWPSELSRSRGHEPDWLDISVNDLWTEKQHAGLAFEMVALRSIEEGEEILLDYGTEWEVAWQKHVQTYNAPQTDYTSLTTLNDAETLKTQEEQSRNPYPSNAQIMMELAFVQSIEWQSARWSRSRATLLEWKRQIRGWQLIECEIMDRKDGDRNGYYKVGFSFEQKYHVAEGLPREAFEFKDKPYTSDIHLHNAFRHDMRVPDEIFPEAWKNIR
jgi:hypothetical protein